jgi:hypothetical protein
MGEVCAATVPDLYRFALLPDEGAEAVVLHLVQPVGPGGRSVSLGSHGRMKPPGGFRRQRGAKPFLMIPTDCSPFGWRDPQLFPQPALARGSFVEQNGVPI